MHTLLPHKKVRLSSQKSVAKLSKPFTVLAPDTPVLQITESFKDANL